MNDTPKKNTPPPSMPPAVSSASDAQCAVLLEQWGMGKCAIITSNTPVSPPVSTKQPITEESIHRMLLKLALQCHGGPGGGKYGKYFRRFWADALNRVLDEAMRIGVVSEEYDVRDDQEP